MIDREKVKRGLEAHANHKSCETCAGEECPYYNMGGGFTGVTCSSILATDALSLLKEQEAKPPIINDNSYGWKFYYCPSCKKEFYQTTSLDFVKNADRR